MYIHWHDIQPAKVNVAELADAFSNDGWDLISHTCIAQPAKIVGGEDELFFSSVYRYRMPGVDPRTKGPDGKFVHPLKKWHDAAAAAKAKHDQQAQAEGKPADAAAPPPPADNANQAGESRIIVA